MRKIFGYFLSWVLSIIGALLISTGILLFSPLILGALCLWAIVVIRCWANGNHTYDPKQILSGTALKSMRCTKCFKLISSKEEARVQAQIDVFIASLRQSREFLNTIFQTPEERAVDDIIEETKVDIPPI